MNTQNIVGEFELPDELAKELSELLIKQNIREKVLTSLVDQPSKYEDAEKLLIPITSRVEAIKYQITTEFVPPQYRDPRFTWNYNGYDIDGNKVMILED